MISRDDTLSRGFTGSVFLQEDRQETPSRGEGSRGDSRGRSWTKVWFSLESGCSPIPQEALQHERCHSVAPCSRSKGLTFLPLYQPVIGCGLPWKNPHSGASSHWQRSCLWSWKELRALSSQPNGGGRVVGLRTGQR